MTRQDQEACALLEELRCFVSPDFSNAVEVGMQAIETLAKVRAWYERTTTSAADELCDAMNELGNTILRGKP